MTSNKAVHYLRLAKDACQYSDNKKARLGSVIVYKGKVISVGWNLGEKTHPLQKEFNKYRGYDPNDSTAFNTLHAEIHALLKINGLDIDWRKATVFVSRVKKDGSKGLAKPCKACETYMRELGIKNVYYTTDNGWGFERYD